MRPRDGGLVAHGVLETRDTLRYFEKIPCFVKSKLRGDYLNFNSKVNLIVQITRHHSG
jgi:hypothetical protein